MTLDEERFIREAVSIMEQIGEQLKEAEQGELGTFPRLRRLESVAFQLLRVCILQQHQLKALRARGGA